MRSDLLIAKTTASMSGASRITPDAFICMCTLLVCSTLLPNQSGSGCSINRTAAGTDINRHKHRCTHTHTHPGTLVCDENKETLALLTPPPITHAASTPSSQLSQLQKLYKYTHTLSHIRTHPHTPVFLAHTFSRSPWLPPVGACVPTLCRSVCVCVGGGGGGGGGLPYSACLWPCSVRPNSWFTPASSDLSQITATQSVLRV